MRLFFFIMITLMIIPSIFLKTLSARTNICGNNGYEDAVKLYADLPENHLTQERKISVEYSICYFFDKDDEVKSVIITGVTDVNKGNTTQMVGTYPYSFSHNKRLLIFTLTDNTFLSLDLKPYLDKDISRWSGEYFTDGILVIENKTDTNSTNTADSEILFKSYLRNYPVKDKSAPDYPCSKEYVFNNYSFSSPDERLVIDLDICQSLLSIGGVDVLVAKYVINDKQKGTYTFKGHQDITYKQTHHNDDDTITVNVEDNVQYFLFFGSLAQTSDKKVYMEITENGQTTRLSLQ